MGRSRGGEERTGRGDAVANIGKSIIVKGELSGDEDLEIEGRVEGDIKLPNHVLTIGAHGHVKAEISAKCVQVVGHVAGNVIATERVEVQASGVVEGDIRAPRLLVQEGAIVNGAIQLSPEKAAGGATDKAPTPSVTTAPPSARKAG